MALYSEALGLDPKAGAVNALLYCNRAAAQMALGKFDAAVQDCSKALGLKSKYPKALLRRARAAVQIQRFPEASRQVGLDIYADQQAKERGR